MFRKCFFAAIVAGYMAAASAAPLGAKHVLVVEEGSGQVLYERNAAAMVPIASLTKLMTAMVILDANPDMDEPISIEEPETPTKKRSWSRLPLGTTLPRRIVLQLALMSSDNRAAASLARAYPGGMDAFIAAVRAKAEALGMTHTTIEEPTGLSSNNRSTAGDLVKMVEAAAQYPDIARITTDSGDVVDVNGRALQYHNTNRLVGQKGWDILLSKTGTTAAAGRCLIMRLESAGRTVVMVLLNAKAGSARFLDAMKIRNFLAGDTSMVALDSPVHRTRTAAYFARRHKPHRHVELAKADAP
ncbi:MAG: serine hydrolase [Rhodocyclaceae bacterium]|nr:serine hydrolase [Rhodocyclaceae bacterium]